MLINKLAVRADASYVVNGDYHVPNMAGFVDQYAECKTWAAVHPELVQVEPEYIAAPPTIEDQLAAIESEYAPKIAALQTALVAATLTDGSIMDGNIPSLRTEWTALLNAKSSAMEALLI